MAILIPKNVYTFIADDGTNTHIDAEGLRRWCIDNKPEIFWLPLKYDLAMQFMKDNTVSRQRVMELLRRHNRGEDLDPIIMVKDGTYSLDNGGPNVLLVDGHHRYMLACLLAQTEITGHLLEVEQWKPFQLEGLPSLTKEQLVNIPITKRDY